MASDKAPYFGKNKLWWCRECDLPLVSEKCNHCGTFGTKINLTPPQDARPAFAKDVELVNSASCEHFGTKLLDEGSVTVLNRIPALDRAEEIISHGRILGRIFHEGNKWVLKPTVAGASIMLSHGVPLKKIVRTTDSIFQYFKQGDLLAPGVTDSDEGVRVGDEVIIISENNVACGAARLGGNAMKQEGAKGVAVKVRDHGPLESFANVKESKWDAAVAANSAALKAIEAEACVFVKRIAEREAGSRPIVVSFSGGKDSLAVFLIAKEALGPDGLKVLFADTGLEFPETLEFIEKIRSENPGCEFIQDEASRDAFWNSLPVFGMPTRSYRWCCKVCKLAPASRMISRNFPNTGCVSLMGERRYESHDRARRPRIDVNPWLKAQLHAYPILEWNALEVWLYTFWKDSAYNPLYEEGFSRIGCWLCPAADEAEWETIRRLHPELVLRLEGALNSLEEAETQRLKPYVKSETTDEATGVVTLEAELGFAIQDPSSMMNACPWAEGTIGTDGILVLSEKNGKGKVVVKHSGAVSVSAGNKSEAERLFDVAAFAAVRSVFCTGCSLCENNCPTGAIRVMDCGNGKFAPRIDGTACNSCGLCSTHSLMKCPAWLLLSRNINK